MLRPLVFAGPSGVGKSTLIKYLFETYPGKFAFSVSHTTRPVRGKEQNGVEYYFVDFPTIRELEEDNKMIEVCNVHSNLYGTSYQAVKDIQSTGKVCVLDLDVQGCEKVKAKKTKEFDPAFLFILPKSLDVLITRIRNRGDTSEKDLETRLNTARMEMQFYKDNKDMFDAAIVNDDLATSCAELKQFVEKHLFDESGSA